MKIRSTSGFTLMELLLVVVMIVGIQQFMGGGDMYAYVLTIASGVAFPYLPNGGWSLTVEFHYYLILPLILWMLRTSNLLPVSLIIVAIALRCIIYQKNGGSPVICLQYNYWPNRSIRTWYGCISVPRLFYETSFYCYSTTDRICSFLLVFRFPRGILSIPVLSIR